MEEQLLKEYVATYLNPKYNRNWDVVNSKFPELSGVDKQLLKEYVSTYLNPTYKGDWNVVNSKFPELFAVEQPKKKGATVSQSSAGGLVPPKSSSWTQDKEKDFSGLQVQVKDETILNKEPRAPRIGESRMVAASESTRVPNVRIPQKEQAPDKIDEKLQQVEDFDFDKKVELQKVSTPMSYLNIFSKTIADLPADLGESWSVASAFIERQLGKAGVPGANPNLTARDLHFYKMSEDYRKFTDEVYPSNKEDRSTFIGGVASGLGQVVPMFMTGGISMASKAKTAIDLAKTALTTGSKLTPFIKMGKDIAKQATSPSGLIGGSQMSSAMYRDAIESGATEDQAQRYAIENFFVGTIAESLPIQSMFSRILKIEPNASILRVLKEGGIGASEEALTEMWQTTYENLSAQRIYDLNREMLDGVGEAGAIGGTIGFILNTALAALTGRRARVKNEDEAKTLDKSIEEVQSKINTVNKNNEDIITLADELETLEPVVLKYGDADFTFIKDKSGKMEFASDPMTEEQALEVASFFGKTYKSINFLVDEIESTNPLAPTEYKIVAMEKAADKGDSSLLNLTADSYTIDGSKMDRGRFVAAVQEAKTEDALNDLETTDPEVQKIINAKRAEITGQSVVETDIVTDEVYNNFVDKNVVPDDVLNTIADKVISRTDLSEKETAIFNGKTSEINEIIKDRASDIQKTTTATQPVTINVADQYTTDEVNRVKALPVENEDGATMNLDGTKYEKGGVVIPLASRNLPISELTPEKINEFVKENSESIGSDLVKVGIYKFPGRAEASIDINIVADRSRREEALQIARELGQESIFDLDTFENIKTGADGKNPKVLTPKEFLEIQERLSRKPEATVTPETSSNYANMTEDNEGNFVFFHVGDKGYETIKPGTGMAPVTSREEAAALGKVGGMAMYYTGPEQGERQSAQGAKYAVKVPKNKVYDFNTDPLNLIEEAKKRHEAENPGKAFDPNSQIAYVTKIAGEKGFDMVVAEWAGGTRAQTTKELAPVDVEESTGNVVEKKFSEAFKSNKEKGFKAVVPARKADKLQKVYEKINEERNSQKRYDDLYRLYTETDKYTQQEITDLINESDLSQELKDEYKSAIESKEETRRSEKPVNLPENVEEAIKNSAKTLQTSFPGVEVIVADNIKDAKKKIVDQLTPIIGLENAENVAEQMETARGQAVSYNGKPIAVIVNKETAISNTAAHEVWHLILRDAFGRDVKKFKSFQNAISRELKAAGYTDVAEYLDNFAASYEGDTAYEEYLAELGGLLTTKGFDPKNLTAEEKTILNKIKDIINKFAKSMIGKDVFLKDAKPENILQFMIDVSDLLAKGEDVRPAIGKGETKKGEGVESSLQANFSDKESRLTFIYDKNSEKFDKLKRDGFINDDVSINDFNGKIMLLHQPDAAFSGEIQKNGETIVEGKGGIFFPAKFHDELLFWASTKNAITKLTKDLNEISKRNGGKIYMALTSAPYHKLLSSTTMSNALVDFFSSKVVDKNFKISNEQLKSSLIEAAKYKENKKITNPVTGKVSYKEYGLRIDLSEKDSIESIKSKIAEKLGAENSTFDDRKLFSTELIRLMANEIKKNDVSVSAFGKLFSQGIQNKYFKGVTKTGKINISAANMVQALSEMFTEPMLKEGFNDRSLGGEVYAILEVDGEVEAVDIDKHESYPSAVKAKNPVKIHILSNRENWYDVFSKEGETGGIKKGERISVYPSNKGVSSIGLQLNIPEQTSRDIEEAIIANNSGTIPVELEVSQQKGLTTKELNNKIASLDEAKKKELLSIARKEEYSPNKKVKAYKLFRVNRRNPGELFPLFVNSDKAVPVGYWVKAAIGELAPPSKSGSKKVKSKLGPLAFRPGWHSGDIPVATHIGEKSNKTDEAPSIRPKNQVWAEVEVADDFNWQEEALKRAEKTKNGKIKVNTAHITDRLPDEGHYKYKTNSNMTGSWIISGEMKVLRVLSDEEVKSINDDNNASDLKRLTPLDKKAYGFDEKGYALDKSTNDENIIAEFFRYSVRNNLKNEVVDTLSEPSIEVSQQKQLPARVNEQINNIISEQKALGNKPVDIAREAAKYLKSTDAYKKLGDRDKAKVLSGVKRLSGMRVKVTVDEYAALKDQIKLEARSAKNYETAIKSLVASVRSLVKTGKISSFRAGVIIGRIAKTNLASPEAVNKTINYVADIFDNANLAMKVSRAKSLVKNAKRNIKSKIGQNPDLFTAAKVLLSIDPHFIPTPMLDDYLNIMEIIGERARTLSIKDTGEMAAKMNVIINSVINESKDAITAGEQTKTKTTPEESAKAAEKIIEKIENEKLDTSKVLDKNSNAVARKIESINRKDMTNLLSKDEDGVVDYSKLNLLLGIRDNIKAGIVTNEALNLATTVEQNRGVDTFSKVLPKIDGMSILNGVTRTLGEVKSLITNKTGVLQSVRGTGTFNIDDVLGNFNDTTIYKLTFGKLASAKGKLDATISDRAAKASAAEILFQKGVRIGFNLGPIKFTSRTNNDVVKAKYKVQTLLLQKEFESNPGNESVSPAIDFINATIKAITKKESSLTKQDAKILREIKTEFGAKDADGKETLNFKKMEESLTENDKKAMKLIEEINASTAEEALFTSSVIRGNRVDILNNYVHHAVSDKGLMEQMVDLVNKLLEIGPKGKPSTKAGTLNERTPGAKAIIFDPVFSSMKGARETLTDFYMTPAIREVSGMLDKLENKVFDDLQTTEAQRDSVQAVKQAVREALEITFQNHFSEDSFGEALIKGIQKLGYQSMLASLPRAGAELVSNMSYAILSDPLTMTQSVKLADFAYSSDMLGFLENIGSSEATRLAGNEMLTSKYAESGFAAGYGRTSKSGASSKVMNYASFIGDMTVGNLFRTNDVTADLIVSTPDKSISKPYYAQLFVNKFKELTGIELSKSDLKKISEGTSEYLSPEYENAIQKSREEADLAVVRMAGSTNSFNTILKNVPRKTDKPWTAAYRAINSLMARFYLTEYGTTRSAIIALFKTGQISRQAAIGLMTGSLTRMSMYLVAFGLLSKLFDSAIANLLDLEEPEEEEEDLMTTAKRSIVGSGVNLLTRRTLGNVPYIPVALGVELLNEELGEDYGLRDGDYDPYKNSLVFSKITSEDFYTKSPYEIFGKVVAGPFSPIVSTGFRAITLGARAVKEGSKPETKKRAMDELTQRMSMEAVGNFGLIPFYKDARRIMINDFYARNYDKKEDSSFTITKKQIDLVRKSNPRAAERLESRRKSEKKKGKKESSYERTKSN